jgi:hypothetical protein
MDRILTWFINAWTIVTLIAILMGFGGMMLKEGGIAMIGASLIDYRFYFTVALIFSPALAAMWWKEKRRSRNLDQ